MYKDTNRNTWIQCTPSIAQNKTPKISREMGERRLPILRISLFEFRVSTRNALALLDGEFLSLEDAILSQVLCRPHQQKILRGVQGPGKSWMQPTTIQVSSKGLILDCHLQG